LISFNNSIDFVQQFHWFCLAIPSVLFGNSAGITRQKRQNGGAGKTMKGEQSGRASAENNRNDMAVGI